MDVSVVIVGINQWKEYTFPFVKSIEKYEPRAKVCVVDNGSYPEYPRSRCRIERTVCYAKAINEGIRTVYADWYVIANNDVLCEGPFIKHLKKLDKNALYGNQINGNSDCHRYIEGWIYYLSRDVLNSVGMFDPYFKCAGYEDVDYSLRAANLGLPILKLELPFRHLKAETRNSMPHYPEIRKQNREYFREKHGFD